MLESETLFNPFPGLRPFEAHEDHLFFGREGQSDELLRRLRRTRFLAVVGTSGSGKSSLVRAGMLPALYGGFMARVGSGWRIAILRPGNDPIGNLALALNAPEVFGTDDENAAIRTAIAESILRRSGLGLVDATRQARMPAHENLLVVVDQFEEVFRFKQSSKHQHPEDEAAAFVKLLLEAAKQEELPIYIVLTMRSDFLGDCAQFRDLPEAINDGQYLIPRMTRDQRRAAITGPVAVGGAEIAPRLVQKLLNDVGDNPDQLPILQHALMRTWDFWAKDHQDNEPIDLRHYEAIGSMAEALSQHADEAYNELPDDRSKKMAEKLFKGLTEKGQDNREIRRPARLAEACAVAEAGEQEVIAVVNAFRREGRSFLMPPADVPLHAESLLDISHESLIRNWERLKTWVNEEARSAYTYRRLVETAVLSKEGQAGLWRDPDLQIALDWQAQNRPNKIWAQRYHPQFDSAIAFLEHSKVQRETEAREKAQQHKRELERRRIRRFAALLSVVFLVVLALGIFALFQRNEAVRQTELAQSYASDIERQKSEIESQKLIVEDSAKVAVSQRMLAEMQRARADSARQQADYLRQVAEKNEMEAQRQKTEMQRQAEKLGFTFAKLFEEKAFVALNEARQNNSRSAYQKAWLYTLMALERAPSDSLLPISYGRFLLPEIRFGAFTEQWLSLSTAGAFRAYADTVSQVIFSPNGTLLTSDSLDQKIHLWEITGWKKAAFNRSGESSSKGSPLDKSKLANLSSKDSITVSPSDTLWSLGKQISVLSGRSVQDDTVTFAPDGARLPFRASRRRTRLFEVSRGKNIGVLSGHSDAAWTLAFSPDSKFLASGSWDNTVRLWEVATGKAIAVLTENSATVWSVAFSPDGRWLASGADNDSIRIWEVATKRKIPAWAAPSYAVSSVACGFDSKLLASGSGDGTVRLWKIPSGEALPFLFKHKDEATSVAFSPDRRLLASSSRDSSIRLSKIPSGEEFQTLAENKDEVWVVAFSPDGKLLASGLADNTICLWEVASKNLLGVLSGHSGEVASVAFSPDGKLLASGSMDGTARLWEVASRKEIAVLSEHTDAVPSVAFSPDGKWLASSSQDQSIRLYNLSHFVDFVEGEKVDAIPRLRRVSFSLLPFRLSRDLDLEFLYDETSALEYQKLIKAMPAGVDPVDWILQNVN